MTDRSESSLTDIVEQVAKAEYERQVSEALKHPGPRGKEVGFPMWENIPLNDKVTLKNHVLLIAWDILNIVDAEPHKAKRGDEVESWIKAQRDRWTTLQGEPMLSHESSTAPYHALDDLLDDYRLHADTGMPLSETVEER